MVGHEHSRQAFTVGLRSLRELAYDTATLVAVLRQPDIPLFGTGDNGLRDLQSLKNLSFPHVGQEDDGGPTLLMEMLAKPGGDHGMNSGVESPPADSREAGEVFPYWEREWPR